MPQTGAQALARCLLARIIHESWGVARATRRAILERGWNLAAAMGVRTLVHDERGTHDDDSLYAADAF